MSIPHTDPGTGTKITSQHRIKFAVKRNPAPSMKVLVLHGFWGNSEEKAGGLGYFGAEVCRPKLSNFSFSKAVDTAQMAVDDFDPDCIVGSSRGGAVALHLTTDKPLVLLAPAWKKFGQATGTTNRTTILHGAKDDVIPLDDSLELKRNCPDSKIVVVDDGHRLLGDGFWEMLAQVSRYNPDRWHPWGTDNPKTQLWLGEGQQPKNKQLVLA